jgi:hypothetical protein
MAMKIQLNLHLRTPSWAEKGLAIRRQGAQEKHSREVKIQLQPFPTKPNVQVKDALEGQLSRERKGSDSPEQLLDVALTDNSLMQ